MEILKRKLVERGEEFALYLEIAWIAEFLLSPEKLTLLQRASSYSRGCIDMVEQTLKCIDLWQNNNMPRGDLSWSIWITRRDNEKLGGYKREILWQFIEKVRFVILLWYYDDLSEDERSQIPIPIKFFDPQEESCNFYYPTDSFWVATNDGILDLYSSSENLDVKVQRFKEIDARKTHLLKKRLNI